MATSTQFNPTAALDAKLKAMGASRTVYALVSDEVRSAKAALNADPDFPAQFEEAWTGKQDAYHREFFDTWVKWSAPLVDFDRTNFPHFYPTSGASEPLRQLIFEFAVKGGETIHVFEGEYEGYKAYAEAAHLKVVVHKREDWKLVQQESSLVDDETGMFCISQPSAIDGNVWNDFNAFVETLGAQSIIVDVTYVGAVHQRLPAPFEKFNLNAPSIRNIVFSLSKPFGAYYDRIGGVWCRQESEGLFGNTWFKNLTSIALGTRLMKAYGVFHMPHTYAVTQAMARNEIELKLGFNLTQSDVYILAYGKAFNTEMCRYLSRDGKSVRVCLTPEMANIIGKGDQ